MQKVWSLLFKLLHLVLPKLNTCNEHISKTMLVLINGLTVQQHTFTYQQIYLLVRHAWLTDTNIHFKSLALMNFRNGCALQINHVNRLSCLKDCHIFTCIVKITQIGLTLLPRVEDQKLLWFLTETVEKSITCERKVVKKRTRGKKSIFKLLIFFCVHIVYWTYNSVCEKKINFHLCV